MPCKDRINFLNLQINRIIFAKKAFARRFNRKGEGKRRIGGPHLINEPPPLKWGGEFKFSGPPVLLLPSPLRLKAEAS